MKIKSSLWVLAAGGQGRTFRVEARPDSPLAGAYPGVYARLGVPAADESGSTWIPEDALVERGQLTGIFLIEDDSLRLRWVRLGLRQPGAVELLSGPGSDLRIVRRPAVDLVDGLPVGAVRLEAWEPGAATVAEGAR